VVIVVLLALTATLVPTGDGPAIAASEPPFYRTPKVKGDLRTIEVGTGDSLQAAFDSARPGDTIRLASGRHEVTGNLVMRRSGTEEAWIKIETEPGAERAVIDLNGSGELRLSGSYVALRRVKVRKGGGNNIHVAPEGGDLTHVVVRKTQVRNLVWGPGAAIKVNRNGKWDVKRVYLLGNDVSQSIANAVIDGVGVRKSVARGNRIHDNAVGSHGIFFKGGSSNILIEENEIWGIRQNAALQLGGNTGPTFFDPKHPNREGVDQVVRRNHVYDFDDSAIEIRGVRRGDVYDNVIETQTSFAIFRLSCGNKSGGGQSGNDAIAIHDNYVAATGDPQYARNDCGPVDVTFKRQTWQGTFHNSPSPGPGIPAFPRPSDTVIP
jgi:hypothetical protein